MAVDRLTVTNVTRSSGGRIRAISRLVDPPLINTSMPSRNKLIAFRAMIVLLW